MHSVGYTHSLVIIYSWEYYDLLTKSVDSTDSDHILKKSNFVSFIFHTFTSYLFQLNYSSFNSFPLFILPHHMFSPPLTFEPSTLRFWAWRAIHYTMLPVQKSWLKTNLINGFLIVINLQKNYRIFQYFSLIMFMVLTGCLNIKCQK